MLGTSGTLHAASNIICGKSGCQGADSLSTINIGKIDTNACSRKKIGMNMEFTDLQNKSYSDNAAACPCQHCIIKILKRQARSSTTTCPACSYKIMC
jgi:hypothetical protein